MAKLFAISAKSAIVLFTLVVITFKCSSNINQALRNMPRCFWYGVCKTILLLKHNKWWRIFLAFLLKIISWACLLVSGLKLLYHWKAHLLIWYKWLLNSFAEVSTSWITENKDVSSANNFTWYAISEIVNINQEKKRIQHW